MEKRLEQILLFLHYWYAPWGAAKAAVWEGLSGDKPFNAAEAIWIIRQIANGDLILSETEIKGLHMWLKFFW